MDAMNKRAQLREVRLPTVDIDQQTSADGTVLLRSLLPLRDFDANIVRSFLKVCSEQPTKTIYAQRRRLPDNSLGEWQHETFADAAGHVRSIGEWLLSRNLGKGDTALIISGNSIAHALMRLGTLAAGVCASPVSANYALMGGNYERLRYVIDLVRPKVIFAETGGPFAIALQACAPADCIVVTSAPDEFDLECEIVDLNMVFATAPGAAVDAAIEASDPDEHALYMLTSGSTGMPKAVIQTQRMLGTNLHQAFQTLGEASGWDDVMLDWLPWSHVSGAFNLLAAAVFGGTLYIDDGKPAPGLFDETLRNLREIAVPYFCNVPSGFAILVDALEQDAELRTVFFSKLRMLLYGGAGLPQQILDRLQSMAIAETGGRIFMTTGYGATETSSGCMAIYYDTDKVGIGLPMPGLEVKLVPRGDRHEVRLRGDNVTPGYLHNPDATAEAFDDDGFYRTGDAARFHDDNDVTQGLYFAGRLVEEFKLGSGTWVYAGQVRAQLLDALAPAVSDLLLCGIGRGYLAVLGVANNNGLGQIAGDGTDITELAVEELLQDPAIRKHVEHALHQYNEANPAGSRRIARFAFMREAPSAARYELSDKGTLNQSIAAERRTDEIDALYATTPDADVLVVG